MNAERIRQLNDCLPPQAALYPNADPSPSVCAAHDQVINRAACALMDPSFPWNFAMAFVKLKLPLPAEAREPYLIQAYAFAGDVRQSARKIYRHLVEARTFLHPAWAIHRQFLEALLIIPDLPLKEIAALTGTHLYTVQIYESLFFHVRDRMEDKLYINHLVYPANRYAAIADRKHDADHTMIQAAYNSGVDAVLRIYGARRESEVPMTPKMYAWKFNTQVLAEALHLAETGGLNQADSPVLKHVFKVLGAAGKANGLDAGPGDDEMGLIAVGLGPGKAIMDAVKDLTDNSFHEARLKEYDERHAQSAGSPPEAGAAPPPP